MIRVALLGASGSIGASTLAVLRQHRDRFRLQAVAVQSNWQALLPIIDEFGPDLCAVHEVAAGVALRHAVSQRHPQLRIEAGIDAVTAIASLPEIDVVVAGISGFAGLPSTWAAVAAGKCVLLANKEALVAAGRLMLDEAERSGALLLPIDSEHNAVFQCANGLICDPRNVRAITLTASGGPFRLRALDSFDTITPDEACKHPTWAMGRKISVDSATLMNKGLEVIEAALLFRRPASDVHVMIHPTSTVHAMVEFVDGSILAHVGPADMQVPIAHALAIVVQKSAGESNDELPRLPLTVPRLSLTALGKLEFFEVDQEGSEILAARKIETIYNMETTTCGRGGDLAGYPQNLILHLNRPFSLPYIPVEKELARLFLDETAVKTNAAKASSMMRATRRENSVRTAYLELMFHVHSYKESVNTAGGMKAVVYAQIDFIRVYADKEKEKVLFERNMFDVDNRGRLKRLNAISKEDLMLPEGPIFGETDGVTKE